MKKLFYAALAAFVVASVPTSQAYQTKIRVAIWDFENNAEARWWFRDQLGDAARNQIDNAFSENEELSRRFIVVEREKLAMVMKEQGLGASGAVDAQTAAKVGQILGVKYIVTGGIDKFAINTTRGGIGVLGGNMTNAEATISLRFIDSTTAERVISVSADGNVRKGGGRFRSANLSRDDEWGIASEAMEKASQEVVKKLTEGNYMQRVDEAAGSGGGIDMRIVRVDGQTAYINVGRTSGIKVGDKFTIHRKGEDLIDPATGMNLGATEKQVGTAVVTDVQDRFAIVTITGEAAAADVLKKGS
jgi:curli biogenesis system outer membrane secretion channel CsgG